MSHRCGDHRDDGWYPGAGCGIPGGARHAGMMYESQGKIAKSGDLEIMEPGLTVRQEGSQPRTDPETNHDRV
jgi:hypothetical protein